VGAGSEGSGSMDLLASATCFAEKQPYMMRLVLECDAISTRNVHTTSRRSLDQSGCLLGERKSQ